MKIFGPTLRLLSLSLTLSAVSQAQTAAKLSRDVWVNLPGITFPSSFDSGFRNTTPNILDEVDAGNIPTNIGDEFYQRIRGSLTAPVTGDYVFWIVSDDSSRLFLSSDSSKFSKTQIASLTGHARIGQWTKYPTQESVVIPLTQGQSYYFEAQHKEGGGGDHLIVGWSINGGPRVNIPAAQFTSFTVDPDDLDDDDLLDSWETLHGLDPNDNGSINPDNGLSGDPDGDGLGNLDEYINGTHPNGPTSGRFRWEAWDSVFLNIYDFVRSPKFYGTPTEIREVVGPVAPVDWDERFASRMRGVITAPVTGDYLFWSSGDDLVDLYLSGDETPFLKRKIAYNAAHTGVEQWDRFPSQQSEYIHLVAGQKYYMEVLHIEGRLDDHVTIGWTTPGGAREVIPQAYVESFANRADDLDDDGLPDQWEILHGLDPQDNGETDINNGQYGDLDDDGITNQQEYLNGNSPVTNFCQSGVLTRDVWTGILAVNATEFRHSLERYEAPNVSEFATSTSTPVDWGDRYAQRLRGTIEAPVSGEYTFWISSDNSSELWLSDNALPFNKKLIAEVTEFTAVSEWDQLLDQKSRTIFLNAGQKYYMEVWHYEGTRDDHLQIAWEYPGSAQQVIPSQYLQSYCPTFEDPDNDEMPSSWEVIHGFDPNSLQTGDYSPVADPDGDGLSNAMEALRNTNPFLIDASPCHLLAERWYDTNLRTVEELVELTDFYDAPDYKRVITDLRELDIDASAGTRVRGYLTAPATGTYYFWVSALDSIELWLSDDHTKYRKRQVAIIGANVGTGHGVSDSNTNRWDHYVSQMTEGIELVEGQKYYIEILGQNNQQRRNHFSVAWAPPSIAGESTREPMPLTQMTPYILQDEDLDDDYLPDAWELQYGLDPSDNGFTDLQKQGERGDFDTDGLTNLEEYLLGTDPTNPDSDGDGISDFDEHRVYHTDPSVSDASPELVVDTITLSTQSSPNTAWVGTGSGGLLASSFRGTGTWNFNIPEHGHYVVQMSAQIRGDLRVEESLPVIAMIDGHKVERSVIAFRGDVPGTLRILTPWLPAGQHEFSIFIDNNTIRRSLEVSSINILTPGGGDFDGNGLADWADQKIAARSGVWANTQISHISPAFIEGLSPSESLVDLTTINRSGQTNRLNRFTDQQMQNMLGSFDNRLTSYANRLQPSMQRVQIHPTWYHHNGGRMEGTVRPHQDGPGTQRWFAKIDLPSNEAIGYVAQFENLGTYDTGSIAWMPVNVFTTNNLTIPLGSKLLVGAWIQDWDWRSVTLNIEGQNHTFRCAQSRVHEFTAAGSHTITATHQDGTTGTLTVDVKEVILPDHLSVGEQRFFDISLPNVASNLALDTNNEVPHDGLTATSHGSTSRLGGLIPGRYLTAARLAGQTAHPGGRGTILNQTETYVVGVSDALRHVSDITSPIDADLFLVRSPLLVTHLPPGSTIEAVIFAGGVTFPDGTTTKTLTEANFDESGVYTFEFHVPLERLGAPCHYIDIYNGAGQKIWNSTN